MVTISGNFKQQPSTTGVVDGNKVEEIAFAMSGGGTQTLDENNTFSGRNNHRARDPVAARATRLQMATQRPRRQRHQHASI